jgi:divinyl protochlorophyllide a 8-vinyl-reductase
MGAPTLHALAKVLQETQGDAEARRLLALSGVTASWDEQPRDAIAEADFLSLVGFVTQALAREEVLPILERAGKTVGDWFVAARIPAPARFLLHPLPQRMTYPLMVRILEVHGWTVLGGGALVPNPEFASQLLLFHSPAARAFAEPRVLHAYYLAALHPIFTFFLGPDLRVETQDAIPPREGIALVLRPGAGVRP